MFNKYWLISFLLLLTWQETTARQVTYPVAFTGIDFDDSLDMQAPPDGSDRLFVVEQFGTIQIVEDIYGTPSKVATPFFVMPDATFRTGYDSGLLGMTFHPDFANNGYFYVQYTVNPPGGINYRVVIRRYTVSTTNPNLTDYTTELDILGVNHPFPQHNSGQLVFDADGYLIIGMGDGGSGGDPNENAQDNSTLMGTLMRIDVDGGGLPPGDCSDITPNYTIPADNPFVGIAGSCDEIYAFGLRNPWRFSIGPAGNLWVADVGQDVQEEVSWVTSGDNLGWDDKEGTECFEEDPCDDPGYTDPVYSYFHTPSASISGGYVYEGASCGALSGHYLLADYIRGYMRSLEYDANGVTRVNNLPNLSTVTSFGLDSKKNLYLTNGGGALRLIDCSSLEGVSLKIFLAGPYDALSDAMTDELFTNDLLPTMQPYNSASFDGSMAEHDGNESLDASLFPSGPGVVDWVVVELRDSPTAAATRKRAALLRTDGSITDFDGGPVRFFGLSGSFHAVVHHRNHLSIMSSSPITLSAAPTIYDFTTAQSQAYGTNPMQELESGVYGMYGGDGNSDSDISANDFLNIFLPENGTLGYLGGDYNLSGGNTAFDFLEVWLVSNGLSSQAP